MLLNGAEIYSLMSHVYVNNRSLHLTSTAEKGTVHLVHKVLSLIWTAFTMLLIHILFLIDLF